MDNPHLDLVARKTEQFLEMVQRTAVHAHVQKHHQLMELGDMHSCMEKLNDLQDKLQEIRDKLQDPAPDAMALVAQLQAANNDMSAIFKEYGTSELEDVLQVCFGSNVRLANTDQEERVLRWLKKFFHPTSYLLVTNTAQGHDGTGTKRRPSLQTKPIVCQPLPSENSKHFFAKVHGFCVHLYNPGPRRYVAVNGFFDAVLPEFLGELAPRMQELREQLPSPLDTAKEAFDMFLSSLSLQEWLLLPDTPQEVYHKFAGLQTFVRTLKQKPIASVVKEFLADDLFQKRNTIMHLLIFSQGYENEYLAYLLYDLLSSDTDGHVDTRDQIAIFDSLPWCVKKCFKTAMKRTIQYTNDLTHFDMQKIPLEQQICLLKVDDSVKEKAMQKWKEVKSKSEDSGSKARQYLEGLLKIPFGLLRREPILDRMHEIKRLFIELKSSGEEALRDASCCTSADIACFLRTQSQKPQHALPPTVFPFAGVDRKEVLAAAQVCNQWCQKYAAHLQITPLAKPYSCNKQSLQDHVHRVLTALRPHQPTDLLQEVASCQVPIVAQSSALMRTAWMVSQEDSRVTTLRAKWQQLQQYMATVRTTLDNAVHGHDKAKKQVERIIAQWINGEQSGYCFGFEGPPGVGKTSLAKCGLSQCLQDENGNPRPFAMIQMGGDSNGSTLHGHNYTYVGSTWGSIVQILMDKKCMNPIIFIDEVDKISKTEHGKEITGILTHLLDPAQNDCFQDKYFSGIDLDLSKALFILSYNDPSAIDRILLDRVHRVRFEHLSLAEKLSICQKHLLPEILRKMGLTDRVVFEEDVLTFIVEEYTCESGVRKLKELLFEIVGEINLQVLQEEAPAQPTIVVTKESVQQTYLKERHPIRVQRIPAAEAVGVINGLWANAMGQGGIIPIQATWRPSAQFLHLHLTGTQGDTMKESMNVALTLAWERLPEETRKELEVSRAKHGIHIHCPDASTPKDGPSAGAAIACALYSLFTGRTIRRDWALTGEVCLSGHVTEIGGLDLKILGGAKGGVTTFLYPEANALDMQRFLEKHGKTAAAEGLQFHAVKRMEEVLEFMLCQ